MIDQTVDQFAASLDKIGSSMNGAQDRALRRCIPIVRADIEEHFDNAQTAAKVAWAPHAPATVKRYGVHPLLILTGKLKAATLGSGIGHIEEIKDGTLTFGLSGADVPYGAFHQDGTSRMPQREFVALSEDALQKCMDEIAAEMVSLFGSN